MKQLETALGRHFDRMLGKSEIAWVEYTRWRGRAREIQEIATGIRMQKLVRFWHMYTTEKKLEHILLKKAAVRRKQKKQAAAFISWSMYMDAQYEIQQVVDSRRKRYDRKLMYQCVEGWATHAAEMTGKT